MPRAYQITDDSYLIPHALPVPGHGVLPTNAMVVKGREPMLVDTLAIVHRKDFLEEAFNLVDPKDVKWLFISHEDRDHTGSIMQVMEMCPNAKLITNFLGLGKLGEEFHVPLDRVHLLNDGDSLDIGDRTITMYRPPLYDSSATAGYWDPRNEYYYAADCFGVVCPDVPHFTDEMPEKDYEDAFFWMNRANHIWFEHIRAEHIAAAADRIKALQPKMIVSGHGPVERKRPAKICDMIKRISDMKPVQLPSHAEFEAMLHSGDKP
jgi:flavorubredoxin